MKRFASLVLLALVPAAACAQNDSELTQPYDLQVVLKCGAHNWLGKQFRDDLRNNLAGMLQDALGPMAKVSVVDLKDFPPDQWQPLWKEFDAKGFAALDGTQELNGAKTHFLRVDFINGQYELQTRQLDGQTGWVSPLRRERNADRAFVTRLAGKMIGQDFGLVGTIVGRADTVQVQFKGAGLGAPLERWVHKGDVFALYRVMPKNSQGKTRAYLEYDTLVQILDEPKSGTTTAKVVARGKKNPLPSAPTYTFRCVKIPAVTAPLRLRLVDDKGQAHVRAIQIRVHSQAFQDGLSNEEEVLNPDTGGLFVSKRTYDQLAYVRVVTGAVEIAKIPIPVQDDRDATAVVGLNAQSENVGKLQSQRAELFRLYTEAYELQRERFDQLVKLASNTKALESAETTRRTLDEDLQRLRAQKEEVKKEIGTSGISLAGCDRLDAELDKHRDLLNRRIGQLKEYIALDNSPDKVERKLKLLDAYNKAQALVDVYDYDAAIVAFRQIVKDYPEETKVKKELESLEASWAIKSDAHRQARDFIYREWPAAKTADAIAAKLPTARQKMKVCSEAGDKLTLAKLVATLPELGKVLGDEIQALKDGSADAEKSAKLKKLVEDFEKFGQDADAALKG